MQMNARAKTQVTRTAAGDVEGFRLGVPIRLDSPRRTTE